MDWAEYAAARVALDWQIELGADEAIGDSPVDRTELPADTPFEKRKAPAKTEGGLPPKPPVPRPVADVDGAAEAKAAVASVADIEGLRAAMEGFPHCDLKRGARNFVFADGNPDAKVMVIGEAPGPEEDKQGKPFVGRAGMMLDKMFGAIGMSRGGPDPAASIYLTNILPWRPPQDRDPTKEELDMMRPFLERHVELAAPEVLILMGNHACMALMGRKGITRLRGEWVETLGKPALPMFHPHYLLRTPSAKREAWADLLMLKARLEK
ncbi:uracil-DNA glycosylase [Alphaproteobacteria bacterium KMM 3653]|uniref:Type-4 uracil-DNA glycosylase n=2 Tax=Harenicola maris TaxID=2841044 RepID=A0AAP2G4K4_9RHOB|nr:uracil-DNA glycosylase [Harenicola maris]